MPVCCAWRGPVIFRSIVCTHTGRNGYFSLGMKCSDSRDRPGWMLTTKCFIPCVCFLLSCVMNARDKSLLNFIISQEKIRKASPDMIHFGFDNSNSLLDRVYLTETRRMKSGAWYCRLLEINASCIQKQKQKLQFFVFLIDPLSVELTFRHCQTKIKKSHLQSSRISSRKRNVWSSGTSHGSTFRKSWNDVSRIPNQNHSTQFFFVFCRLIWCQRNFT